MLYTGRYDEYMYFFFDDTSTSEIYTDIHTLALHVSRPYSINLMQDGNVSCRTKRAHTAITRTKRAVCRKCTFSSIIPCMSMSLPVKPARCVDRKSTRLNSSH